MSPRLSELVRSGEISAPIVIGREHLDTVPIAESSPLFSLKRNPGHVALD
jgi:urocanate hydratase